MHRSISDKNLAGKPGYDNVVQQFKGSALSFTHEGNIVIPGVDLYFADVGLFISLLFLRGTRYDICKIPLENLLCETFAIP